MQLSIAALGPLQVRLDSVPVTKFRFERVRALLAFLLVEENMVHDRAYIAVFLWPDMSQTAALENLRQAVAMLRRALKDRQHDPPFIIATAKTLQLNSQNDIFFDYAHFSAKIKQARSHAHRSLESCSTCIAALEEATILYRGQFLSDLFIESERFEEWAQVLRSELHFQAIWALRMVMTYYARRQDYMRVIELAQKLLRIDPLCEVGHHMMVTALAAQGHRHAAIHHYEAYQLLLQDELGVEPPQHTAELWEQLLADRWRLDLVDFVPFHNLPATIHETRGREDECKHIANLLAQKECRLVTLTGISGSGKTQLALAAAWAEVPNFHNGTYFVNLTGVTGDEVLLSIMRSLPITIHPEANIKFQLLSWLREKEVLLVLDYFDDPENKHLISTLLQVAPKLSIVVTTPVRLMLRGEHVVHVRGLPLPSMEAANNLMQSSAVQLFLHYLRPLQPHFTFASCQEKEAIISLCRMVGGLPLALELLAYLSLTYPLTELYDRLVEDPNLLSCTEYQLPRRHHCMASIFNDVWQYLSPEERQTFLQLCHLRATFTLQEAEENALIGPDTFLNLQLKSLVQAIPCSTRGNKRPFLPRNNKQCHYEIIPIFRHYLFNNTTSAQLLELAFALEEV